MLSSISSYRGSASFAPPLPRTMSPADLIGRYPNWKPAVDAACLCMASLQIHGCHAGGAVIVGDGIVFTPLHVLMPYSQPIQSIGLQQLIQSLQLSYTKIDNDAKVSYKPTYLPVRGVVEQFPEHDFCLLVCHSETFCHHPPIAYSTPDQCLFAQMDARGNLTLSIVQSCPLGFWENGYCAYSPSGAGSSGGCYFDMSGALIAVHVARSTGLCGLDSGVERKGILARDMVRQSNILFQLQHVCLVPGGLELCASLHPPRTDNRCYVDEKSAVTGTLNHPVYTCSYVEIRHGKQRSIRLILRHNTQRNLISNSEYALRFQNGKHIVNVHDSGAYSGYEMGFYRAIAETFLTSVVNDDAFPDQFVCEYRKTHFVANLESRG